MTYLPVKVLVVEDEILILRNIKKKILSSGSDFVIVGEATNGKEAWEMIETLHPDVVFTDIRMPIMDGLELSGRINETYPEIYTIIISGYDDFEYARTALSNRVYDYLLKPVKENDLKKLLSSLSEKIHQKRNDFLYQYLAEYLNGRISPAEKVPSVFEEDPVFFCGLVCFGNLHIHCPSFAQEHADGERYHEINWDRILEPLGIFAGDFCIFPQQFENIRFFLMKAPEKNPEKAAEYLYASLRNLLPDIPVTMSFHPGLTAFSDLHEERIRLRRHLFSSLVMHRSVLLNVETEKEDFPPAVLSGSTIQYLQSLIQSSNTSGFGQALEPLFHEWQEKQYPQQWIEKVLLQIFTVFQQCLYFADKDYEKMTQSVFSSLENGKDLEEAVDQIIRELQSWIVLNKSIPAEINTTIEEMNDYILSHYREALNISDLAQKYHFNQSYLTRVFKKQKGKSPLKLINELRIRDAREMLMNSSMSVREISEILGFADQHYFSRIFKDVTGQSPKEYRQQNGFS